MKYDDIEVIGKEIVDASLRVHRELGPGLLEGAYEECFLFELKDRGLGVDQQKLLPVTYRGHRIDAGYRIDLLVENKIVIELKAVEQLIPLHDAQLLTYLRLSGCTLGYLINFNVTLLKNGLKRKVHNHPNPQYFS